MKIKGLLLLSKLQLFLVNLQQILTKFPTKTQNTNSSHQTPQISTPNHTNNHRPWTPQNQATNATTKKVYKICNVLVA